MDLAAAYLDRLGVMSPSVDLVGLRQLHEAHLHAVPFENLSVAWREPIPLDEMAAVRKLVGRRRGGFCYELNGAFAWLLRELGFTVDYLEARVADPGGFGQPFDHMVLRVMLDEPHLADVSFGAGFCQPLRIVAEPQSDPWGSMELRQIDADLVDLHRDGEVVYRLSLEPHVMVEFATMCWYHQSSPASFFTQGTIVTLPVPGGRLTVRNRHLIETSGTERHERDLDDREWAEVLLDRFGIVAPG